MMVMDVMDDETARRVVRLDENCMYVLAARHRFSNIEEFRQKVSARPGLLLLLLHYSTEYAAWHRTALPRITPHRATERYTTLLYSVLHRK
mgnify:CR=1 FL=1